MGIFTSMDICATGMTAQRLRTDIISQNIANVNTTRGANGEAYRRQLCIVEEMNVTGFQKALLTAQATHGSGVKVTAVVEDQSEFKIKYDPTHPDATEDGYVFLPNVDVVTEMTNLIDASRSYEANVTAFNGLKSMSMKGLEIGK